MSDYILSCGSAVDLDPQFLREKDIHVVCFNFEIDGVAYKDDLGVTMPYEQFYEKLTQGVKTKTSQINAAEYEEYFEQFVKEGKDVLHVELSGGLTSTLNSATIAVNNLKEKYPNNRIVLVDSYAASLGYGLLIKKVYEKKQEGLDIDELCQWVIDNRLKVVHVFFSSDLSTYIAGGRISKAAGFIGQALGVCPIIHMDQEGRLVVGEKIRTKKKAFKYVTNYMQEYCDNGLDYNNEAIVGHAGCKEDAETLREALEETFPNLKGKLPIGYIGTTIGSHTGPGTAGVVFWGKERTE